jgi:diphthine methyl ester synthase
MVYRNITYIQYWCFLDDAIGVARLGREDQKIVVAGPMGKLVDVDFGSPSHCVVIVGEMNPVEKEMLQFYMIK